MNFDIERISEFTDDLYRGEDYLEDSKVAFLSWAEDLSIAGARVVLHVDPNEVKPEGEEIPLCLIPLKEGESKGKPFVRKFHVMEGGYAQYTIYPRDEEFAPEEEKILLVLIHIHFLCGARVRLLLQMQEMLVLNPLTHLPNTEGCGQILDEKILSGELSDYDGIQINLKSFGMISRRFGAAEGDRLIKKYASYLLTVIEPGEFVGHIGSDNFVFLIRKERTKDFLRKVEEVHLEAGRGEDTQRVTIGCYVGVHPMSGEETDPDAILNAMSVAMNIARNQKQSVVYLTKELSEEISFQRMVEMEFSDALLNGEFLVYFQPKVDMVTGEIVGTEALARWRHEGELVSPGRFIPVLERSGKSLELDLYVLETVCKYISKWAEEGHANVPASVNFSRSDISGFGHSPKELAKQIVDMIHKYNVSTDLIIVEVTETADIVQVNDLLEFATSLKDAGIRISVDDFGTGYSSLSVLRDFPVYEIKVDRSFLNHEDFDFKDRSILESIIRLASQLELKIIAEGVETRRQVDLLLGLGCRNAQGFLYDKPLPKEEFEERLLRGNYEGV